MKYEEELEKEAEEKMLQYMNDNRKEYNSENTKLETDNYNDGLEQGFEDGYITCRLSRDKEIETFEKKVAKLEFSLENKIADYDKLERENEMFKKANEIIAKQRDDRDADISLLENRNDELESQNSKAKELLKKAIKCTWSIDYFVVDEINEFLKENK